VEVVVMALAVVERVALELIQDYLFLRDLPLLLRLVLVALVYRVLVGM
jgi:hypothetical protein